MSKAKRKGKALNGGEMNQAKCAICKEFTIDPITGFKTCKCEVKEVTIDKED